VASYDGMLLVNPSNSQTSGAVFRLNHKAPESAEQSFVPWTVELREGSLGVVARRSSSVSPSATWTEAMEVVHKGLDLFSIRGVADLAIVDAHDEHIVWWSDQQGATLRPSATVMMNVRTGTRRIEVRDQFGNVVPQLPPPALPWHESFRYFRHSQITDDLFDAFRNMYLALEALLSTIAPMRLKPNGRPGEGEGDWFRRALTEANKHIQLATYAPAALSSDPVGEIYNDLYVGHRTAIFHAKSGRPASKGTPDSIRRSLSPSLVRAVQQVGSHSTSSESVHSNGIKNSSSTPATTQHRWDRMIR